MLAAGSLQLSLLPQLQNLLRLRPDLLPHLIGTIRTRADLIDVALMPVFLDEWFQPLRRLLELFCLFRLFLVRGLLRETLFKVFEREVVEREAEDGDDLAFEFLSV